MTAHTGEMSVDLACHLCGYDLRAHAEDGKCPECGASVAESRRVAAIPRRPAWGDSDPRWRRRMLAGTWVLVLLPLMDALKVLGWASKLPVPTVFDYRGTVRTLDETFLGELFVYQPLLFCIGVVLFFSNEPGRRRARLDWTRRWGVLCSYVVLLLNAAQVLFIAALILIGIAAVFHSMPLKYQPGITKLFVNAGSTYLRYGPYPMNISGVVLVAFSSITMLLACAPLFEALRSSGPKRAAAILLAPLALFCLINLARVGRYCFSSSLAAPDFLDSATFFRPELLVTGVDDILNGFAAEAIKWCVVLAIAIWLSSAQLAAWWQRKTTSDGACASHVVTVPSGTT